jgi:hypothetical protein
MSRGLDKSDDVAVCVFHGCDQLAATDISDRLLHLCSGVEEQLETLLEVVNVPVADGPVMPWLWPLGSRPTSWSPTLTS